MSDYERQGHEFDPADFAPGKIHRVAEEAALFSDATTPAVALWIPKYPHNVGAAAGRMGRLLLTGN